MREDGVLSSDRCRRQLAFLIKGDKSFEYEKSYREDLNSALQTTQDNRRPKCVRECVFEWAGVFIQIQYGLPFNTSCLFLSLFTMCSKDENNKVA